MKNFYVTATVGLLLLLTALITWAALAPLDEGIPVNGLVSFDTKRKAVQHPIGGIVKEVRVREGDSVKAGDVLIVLDSETTRANYVSIRQHYLSIRAMESRLEAEQQGASVINFHPDVVEQLAEAEVKAVVANQQQLFNARRAALAASLAALDASLGGINAQLVGLKDVLAGKQSQLAILQQQYEATAQLVSEGFAPRNRAQDLQRNVIEVQSGIADLLAMRARLQQSIMEFNERRLTLLAENRKEIGAQMAEVKREVQADAEKLIAITSELNRIEVKAPVDGQVVGLAVQSEGGVIQAAQKIMDIAPQNEPLVIEAQVPPNYADRVKEKLLADVRFSAFAHSPQLVVEGVVLSVSGDLLTDPATNSSYFLTRIALTERGIQALGDRRVQAGMPAEVVILTGARSVLSYVLYPLTRRIAASLNEE